MTTETVIAPIWFTIKDACERARVSRKVIYRAVHQGKLRAAQIDGRGDYRFRPEWIDAWIEAAATPVEVTPASFPLRRRR